jgi:hypothetical protein
MHVWQLCRSVRMHTCIAFVRKHGMHVCTHACHACICVCVCLSRRPGMVFAARADTSPCFAGFTAMPRYVAHARNRPHARSHAREVRTCEGAHVRGSARAQTRTGPRAQLCTHPVTHTHTHTHTQTHTQTPAHTHRRTRTRRALESMVPAHMAPTHSIGEVIKHMHDYWCVCALAYTQLRMRTPAHRTCTSTHAHTHTRACSHTRSHAYGQIQRVAARRRPSPTRQWFTTSASTHMHAHTRAHARAQHTRSRTHARAHTRARRYTHACTCARTDA